MSGGFGEKWIKFENLSGEGAPLEVSWPVSKLFHMTVDDATTIKLFFDTAYPDNGRGPAYITLTTTSGKSDEVHTTILNSVISWITVSFAEPIIINTSTTDVTAVTYHVAA